MAIGEGTLEENSVPCTILMAGNQTLGEALKQFKDNKYPENDTYLVVKLPNAEYKVILFSNLKNILEDMGNDILNQSLSDLPIIPPASRVVPKDTTESGLDILDWVDTHPQSTVVITEAGDFVGLFVNPNMSGGLSVKDYLFRRPKRNKEQNQEKFQISLLHPRRLAKGFSSTITVNIYLRDYRNEVDSRNNQLRRRKNSELDETIHPSNLTSDMVVILKLSSPAINFSNEVLKRLQEKEVNRVTFYAKPSDNCGLGRQEAVLSIRDSQTNEEYESIPCFFKIDDFAFGFISKPMLSYVSSGLTGIGSLAVFILSFVQKLDAALGIPVGTAGTAFALLLGFRPTFLYKQEVKTKNY